MGASLWISSISLFFAAFSIGISIYTNYVNIKDRRLKDHPFFILVQRKYISEYSLADRVDPYTYNFIYAHEALHQLQNLRNDSISDYRNELNLNRNSVYLELDNCGGIGKNLTITTEVSKPDSLVADEVSHSSIHGHGWSHVTKESPGDGYFTRTGIIANNADNSSITSFYNESSYVTKQKGISSGGTLKIKVPEEFIFFFNLKLLDLIDENPVLKVTVEGVNITDKKFKDVLEIKLDTITDKLDSHNRYMTISLSSHSITK